ncbi:MAG: phosphoribosylformylglycinamidine synthase subunit PurS [Hyphomicrobiales bacterium]
MKAVVTIMLKRGVLDPQGKAVEGALHTLGFADASNVRQGKVIEIDLPDGDEAKAKASVSAMCEKLLANTVIENYSVDIRR